MVIGLDDSGAPDDDSGDDEEEEGREMGFVGLDEEVLGEYKGVLCLEDVCLGGLGVVGLGEWDVAGLGDDGREGGGEAGGFSNTRVCRVG